VALGRFASVTYVEGCKIDGSVGPTASRLCAAHPPAHAQDRSGFAAAESAASAADATIVVVGLDQGQESEGHDRDSIALPGVQSDFIAVRSLAARRP
jgi:beta-glucosidase